MPTNSNEKKTTRQFGLWDSPITPQSLAVGRRLNDVQWDSSGKSLLWIEGRSAQGVLVCREADGEAARDLTSDLSVRAEVGYGGGDFTVSEGVAYFVVHKTGRIYRQALSGGSARGITPAFGKAASPVCSPGGRFVAYVHHDEDQNDCLAVVDATGSGWPQILASGHDFYMQPRFSPDGTSLAWIAWDQPNMPWDGTLLYLASVSSTGGSLLQLGKPLVIAGGPDVAVFQPEFTPDGKHLVFVSDEGGWGQVVRHELATGKQQTLSAEGIDYIRPAWVQGVRTLAVTSDSRFVLAVRTQQGFESIDRIDLASGESAPLAGLEEYSSIDQIAAAPDGERIAFIGSSATIQPRVVMYDLKSQQTRVVARSAAETVPAEALSQCEPISWTTADGETAHGLYYPPASQRFTGIGKPPLVAHIHGGPTGQSKAAWNAQAQFFATRGYGVLSVNYRGSTGYGREYMLRLRGNWGICDVEDATSGAKHLADAGQIDADRTVIMGGSAGGFTVLHTMSQLPESFTAGISLYGVANQFGLAADTHKFEARYLDTMLGPLPEAAAVYRERSPLFHAQNIRRPMAVFQGDIDQVVPRDQSDSIVKALARNGTPHIYHVYEGEGHGWRKTETIVHFYKAVDQFLRDHVLFA